MSFNNFIGEHWSQRIMRENEKLLVLAPLTNRKFEGELKNKGDTVNILGLGRATIGDYDGGDIGAPEVLEDTGVKLVVDKAKYFNVQIDDIDKRQGSDDIMNEIMAEANEAMADEEDRDIGLAMVESAGKTLAFAEITAENARQSLQKAKTELLKNGVKNSATIVATVSPSFLEKLEQSTERLDTDNSKTIANGFQGKVSGIEIYVTNNLPKKGADDLCFVFTKRAVAHAKQISQVEAYRPEGLFVDAMKGLSCYGTKVVRPKEVIMLTVKSYA